MDKSMAWIVRRKPPNNFQHKNDISDHFRVNAFITENPFLGTKIPENSVGKGFGALKGLRNLVTQGKTSGKS